MPQANQPDQPGTQRIGVIVHWCSTLGECYAQIRLEGETTYEKDIYIGGPSDKAVLHAIHASGWRIVVEDIKETEEIAGEHVIMSQPGDSTNPFMQLSADVARSGVQLQLLKILLPQAHAPYHDAGGGQAFVSARAVFDAIRSITDPPMREEDFNQLADEVQGMPQPPDGEPGI